LDGVGVDARDVETAGCCGGTNAFDVARVVARSDRELDFMVNMCGFDICAVCLVVFVVDG